MTEVPLDYALAYGGTLTDETGRPTASWEENPAGLGFATVDALDGSEEWPAPQIGELGEFLAARDPTAAMSVRGFGPVAKAWLPRRALAGTFDDTWKCIRHPRMPRDYDLGFWNAAPMALQLRPFLRGDEAIRLTGLDLSPEQSTFPLPAIGMGLYRPGQADVIAAMALDTVALDLTGGSAAAVLDLIWRATVPELEAHPEAEIAARALGPHPIISIPVGA